jgi:hypothetical protein
LYAASLKMTIRSGHIAGDLYYDKVLWDAGAIGSSGTTLRIYERPGHFRFIERTLKSVVFDDAKCESDKAYVTLQADGRHVMARCPWLEYEHKQGSHDFLVPLY